MLAVVAKCREQQLEPINLTRDRPQLGFHNTSVDRPRVDVQLLCGDPWFQPIQETPLLCGIEPAIWCVLSFRDMQAVDRLSEILQFRAIYPHITVRGES